MRVMTSVRLKDQTLIQKVSSYKNIASFSTRTASGDDDEWDSMLRNTDVLNVINPSLPFTCANHTLYVAQWIMLIWFCHGEHNKGDRKTNKCAAPERISSTEVHVAVKPDSVCRDIFSDYQIICQSLQCVDINTDTVYVTAHWRRWGSESLVYL